MNLYLQRLTVAMWLMVFFIALLALLLPQLG